MKLLERIWDKIETTLVYTLGMILVSGCILGYLGIASMLENLVDIYLG